MPSKKITGVTATTETATVETATPETATTETATVETATPETATTETATVETATPETATTETATVETATSGMLINTLGLNCLIHTDWQSVPTAVVLQLAQHGLRQILQDSLVRYKLEESGYRKNDKEKSLLSREEVQAELRRLAVKRTSLQPVSEGSVPKPTGGGTPRYSDEVKFVLSLMIAKRRKDATLPVAKQVWDSWHPEKQAEMRLRMLQAQNEDL